MKKNFLFGLMGIALAGMGFGGITMAENEVEGCDIIITDPTLSALYTSVTVKCENDQGVKKNIGESDYEVLFEDIEGGKVKFTVNGKNSYNWTYEKEIQKIEANPVIYYSKYITPNGSQKYMFYYKNPQASDLNMGGKYKLYADTQISNNKSIAGSMSTVNVTIDLNGYNFSAYSGLPFIDITKNNKEQNYSIIDTSENKGGKIIVSDSVENAINVTRKNVNLSVGEGVIVDGGKINFQSEGGELTLEGKFTEDQTSQTEDGYYSVYDGEGYYNVTNDIGTTTSFYMSSNAPYNNAEFKVILNEAGTSIDLWKTKAYLNKELSDAEKTASILYQGLKDKTDTDGIEVIEVEGEKLLFINNTINHRTDVFRSSTTGKFSVGTEFVPTQSTEYPSEGLVYEKSEEYVKYPSWVSIIQTPTKYNEIKDGDTLIGYTLLTDGWFYAPKAYKVTFDVNEGVGSYESQIVVINGKAIEPETKPTKEGFIFDGWFKGEEATAFSFDTAITEDATLKAKWSTAYTITINQPSNGGTISSDKATTKEGDSVTLTATPASNYNFGSWTVKDPDNNPITVTDNKFTMPAKNVTVTATFNAKPSTSSSGGGSGRSSSSSTTTEKKDETKVTTGNNEEITLGGEVTEETTTTGEVKEENTKADVVISDAAKSKYKEEQLAAYQWAYENGITTINDADEARLSDPLTRAELAKMMSQYISSVLKRSPIKADLPGYKDVDESLGDLADYIVKAYQYQIMGIDADGNALEYFHPNDFVTRAEYATVFSRVLYGSVNNQKDGPYYEKHLAALKEAGILTEDDPTIQEVRGWVMLMMYRSVNPKAPTQEETKAEEGTGNNVGIANPASTYCVEQEGEIEIREETDGSQYGVCKFKDGTEVEEWEYFRANHKDEASTGAVAESSTGDVAENTTGAVAEATTGAAENN